MADIFVSAGDISSRPARLRMIYSGRTRSSSSDKCLIINIPKCGSAAISRQPSQAFTCTTITAQTKNMRKSCSIYKMTFQFFLLSVNTLLSLVRRELFPTKTLLPPALSNNDKQLSLKLVNTGRHNDAAY